MRLSKSNAVIEEMIIHAETEKAVKASLTGDVKDAEWLPKSQIKISNVRGKTYINMPEWLARDKGFI